MKDICIKYTHTRTGSLQEFLRAKALVCGPLVYITLSLSWFPGAILPQPQKSTLCMADASLLSMTQEGDIISRLRGSLSNLRLLNWVSGLSCDRREINLHLRPSHHTWQCQSWRGLRGWDPCCCSCCRGSPGIVAGQVSYLHVLRVSWGESHPPASWKVTSDCVGTEVNVQHEAPLSSPLPVPVPQSCCEQQRWEILSRGKAPRCVQCLIMADIRKKGT